MNETSENILKSLASIRDGVSEFFAKEKFEFIEYDFSSFRKEILALVKYGMREGYRHPVAAQIEIKTVLTEKNEYIATVSVYFKQENNIKSLHKVGKSYEIHGFDIIPGNVFAQLKEKNEVTLSFTPEDMQELLNNKDLEINTKKRTNLTSLVERVLIKENILNQNGEFIIKICDFLLYYRVRVYDREQKYIGEFLTEYIVGLSEEYTKRLSEKHGIEIKYIR